MIRLACMQSSAHCNIIEAEKYLHTSQSIRDSEHRVAEHQLTQDFVKMLSIVQTPHALKTSEISAVWDLLSFVTAKRCRYAMHTKVLWNESNCWCYNFTLLRCMLNMLLERLLMHKRHICSGANHDYEAAPPVTQKPAATESVYCVCMH